MALKRVPPNSSLRDELVEVEGDAHRLLDCVRGNNNLPLSFPRIQVEYMASTLGNITKGTTIGAFELLKYASRRLPAIRREYLHRENSTESGNIEEPPQQTRGMLLDQRLKDLIASVNTSLDECRRQEGEFETEDEITIRIRHNNLDADANAVRDASSRTSKSVRDASAQFRDYAVGGSARSDQLLRDFHEIGRAHV